MNLFARFQMAGHWVWTEIRATRCLFSTTPNLEKQEDRQDLTLQSHLLDF
jgi:hypothetical protein